jgi:hypothetical protein
MYEAVADLDVHGTGLEGLVKTTKSLGQDSRYPGRGSNRACSEFKSETLPPELTSSAFPLIGSNLGHFSSIQGITTNSLKNAVFWDVGPCRWCMNRRFGGKYRLHLQDIKICERKTSVSRWSAATWSRWFLARKFFYPEDGGDTFLRNVGTSQNTAFFIVTVVKTSNLTIPLRFIHNSILSLWFSSVSPREFLDNTSS